MYLIFDTETTGLPKNFSAPHTDLDNWPRLVQLAWELHGDHGELINAGNLIVKPEGFTIPYNAEKVHGISTERALKEGHPLKDVLELFAEDLARTELQIGHNIEFDLNVMGAEFIRAGVESELWETASYCTKEETTDFVQIPGGRGGKFKWPTLTELHTKVFGVGFADAHDAAYDVMATAKCFFGLIEQRWFTPLNDVPFDEVLYEAPELEEANFAQQESTNDNLGGDAEAAKKIKGPFCHLHVHTQYSILQATPSVEALVAKAKAMNMPAVAMTDHGNMMGAFKFVRAALKEGIKPIVGCEFYVAEDRTRTQFTKHEPDKRFNQVLLAKNKNGYLNIAKLSSMGFMEGLYGLYPRIGKDIIKEYNEDVIALTGNMQGEIPNLILNVGEDEAEAAFLWWLEVFGENFYVELMRHGLDEENHVNRILLQFARKYKVKVLATNNTYYLDKKDANAHDVLLCVRDGELQKTPIGRGRGFRFGFPNQEFYFKSEDEMKLLFSDLPDAIENIGDLVEQCEEYKLESDVLLPAFDIPKEFEDAEDEKDGGKRGENNYLRHLTYVGAEKRYGEITDDIRERLDFELATIAKTGYPGYFLIVQDFTTQAKEMGVLVGPGRGSAAGSAVAYCVGITNVDPIKYDLLFERFLNPDRVSMPDIDIDFDDDGRGRIIEWVVNKYGRSQVAQIITYGTMAAKSSIRDTARVLDMPLAESIALTKLVPDVKLNKLFKMDDDALAAKLKNNPEEIAKGNELKNISYGNDLKAQVIKQALVLEGSLRNTGIHACGVIITPDDITKFVPVSYTKDNSLINTQFDNSVVEDAGLLKMDFLGLKTLTLIRDACQYVKDRHDVDLDPEEFPIDDEETYALFQRGETVGIFQYESAGMQKYMRELKPTVFADLIAMNALYRPGPLEYIPSFIRRKHGEEEITYDVDACKEYLEETYGITVYQEQVMLLSQSLAGFTKGEADTLRKAMGKKKLDLLAELKPKFLDQGAGNGHDRKALEKIWVDWEAFASYAFNKSHSTCYAWIAYQTAYLKAHYPAEYMASVLSNNMNDIKSVTFFMEECSRMELDVLGPDVNESKIKFSVNEKGQIRFGLGAIKGSGEAAVNAIIEEREENGKFSDVFEFAERVNLRQVNKRTFEALAMSGAFDEFKEHHRRQYLEGTKEEPSLTELAIKYANKIQAEKASAQTSLFGGEGGADIPRPKAANLEPFGNLEQLNIEKEVVGLYISGHPLDQFKLELKEFCTCTNDRIHLFQNKEISLGGIVTHVREGQTKTGKPYGVVSVEDYSGKVEMFLMGDFYLQNKAYLSESQFVFMKGKVELDWRKQKEVFENPHAVISEDDWVFKPKKVSLLANLKENFCKGLQLKVDIRDLNNILIEELVTLFSENKGNMHLEIEVYDDKIILPMTSRKFQIDLNNNFIKALDEMPQLKYNVLT